MGNNFSLIILVPFWGQVAVVMSLISGLLAAEPVLSHNYSLFPVNPPYPQETVSVYHRHC